MSGEQELYALLMEKAAALPEVGDSEEVTSQIEETGTIESSKTKPQAVPSIVTAKNLFTHPEAHPIIIGLALVKKYGADWLEWEAETLEIRVPRDFGIREISSLNMSKIHAIKTLHLIDAYWQRWEVFLACTMPFNNMLPDFEVMQVPTLAQCMVSVDTANRVRTDVTWSEEVKAYLSAVYRHDGIVCVLSPLDFVKIDSSEYIVDCDDVHRRWPSVMSQDKHVPEKTPEDAQINRMLDAHQYLKENQNLLRSQLSVIDHV
jgi:hypothetical protein